MLVGTFSSTIKLQSKPAPSIATIALTSAFPYKMSHVMTVETFYLGLVISSSITPIDSDLLTSSLEIPSCSHAQLR
ncbi:hypothetical protein Tco_1342965 [Tanacetum coccineum]